MNINQISFISLRAKPVKKLVPLSKYKGPLLELRFWEEEQINLMEKELLRLEIEAGEVLKTTNINTNLTGYQKQKCKYKLMMLETSIDNIKNKILKIKKERYSKQLAEYLNK